MKKIVCILLALWMFAVPALAEEADPLAPFALTAPEGVTIEAGEGSCTFVYGVTRVVAIVIDRVPDAEPAEAVIRMMAQFDPDAVIGEDLPVAEGYVGLNAVAEDKLGEGVDQITVMILSRAGDLLILSGYDLTGDEKAAHALLDALLASTRVHAEKIVVPQE